MSQCSKPGCSAPGGVVLGYDYAAREVILEDPAEGMVPPHLYLLCLDHAERLTLPYGWTMDDRRQVLALFADEVVPFPPRTHDARGDGQIFFGSSV